MNLHLGLINLQHHLQMKDFCQKLMHVQHDIRANVICSVCEITELSHFVKAIIVQGAHGVHIMMSMVIEIC